MLRPGADAPLSYATAEYCLYIFLFLESEGGAWHSGPPPHASGDVRLKLTKMEPRIKQICNPLA